MFETVYYHKTVVKVEKLFLCMLLRSKIKNIMNIDDFMVETLLREKFPQEMLQLDCRDFSHICEKCQNIKLNKVASLNGHISGTGEIEFV